MYMYVILISDFLFQIAIAFKETVLGGVRCMAIAYSEAAKLAQVNENVLMQHLQKMEGSIKTRLRFLSDDSPTDFFKARKGMDVSGVSQARQCYCIPINIVPGEILQTIRGKYEIDPELTTDANNLNYDKCITLEEKTFIVETNRRLFVGTFNLLTEIQKCQWCINPLP